MIVYKEYEGLSTYYVKDKRDVPKPNYPVPAISISIDLACGVAGRYICKSWYDVVYHEEMEII